MHVSNVGLRFVFGTIGSSVTDKRTEVGPMLESETNLNALISGRLPVSSGFIRQCPCLKVAQNSFWHFQNVDFDGSLLPLFFN